MITPAPSRNTVRFCRPLSHNLGWNYAGRPILGRIFTAAWPLRRDRTASGLQVSGLQWPLLSIWQTIFRMNFGPAGLPVQSDNLILPLCRPSSRSGCDFLTSFRGGGMGPGCARHTLPIVICRRQNLLCRFMRIQYSLNTSANYQNSIMSDVVGIRVSTLPLLLNAYAKTACTCADAALPLGVLHGGG